ncbi:unknown [Bacillus thuringiensis phage MZTP02]|uniref:Uncharacterized protein n=1 Tax=Bacillus thuringiensis phage MZTP02 TaxID=311221 RepID=Q56AQ4_9CAUD|nr:unknown [Bacillus thuringiensis phage MZTP02]
MVGYQLGTLHISWRYIGVKRTGEWGIHCAGVESQQFDAGGPPGQLDGGTLEQHVEGCLGCTIAIPAARSVVANAADTSAENG